MEGARLVGFDLVGLPAIRGRSRDRPEYDRNLGCIDRDTGCAWRQARDDIEEFHRKVARFRTAAVTRERAAARR